MGSTIAGCDRLFHQVKGLTETPHVRGEDSVTSATGCMMLETPPRTWGRPLIAIIGAIGLGNTPTYVGKTRKRVSGLPSGQKHPHVRGEDRRIPVLFVEGPETPPRTWGRRHWDSWDGWDSGNTPTYVGKTLRFY